MSPSRRPRLLAAVAALATAALLPACSSDGGGTAAPTTTSAPSPGGGHACDRPVAKTPTVTPVAGTPSDHTLTSFDGTEIRLHWFPTKTEGTAPVVLIGPGWSLGGDTNPEPSPLFGSLGIGDLNQRGYHVLTWDPRGFGKSTGMATVDAPDTEGRDMAAIVDWLAVQPRVRTDGPGDPRMGMAGYSYGGGIQLTLAAMDCRVDALIPGIAWHSLETSLYKAETVKLGWAGVLLSSAATGKVDPHVTSAGTSGKATGTISAEDEAWFRSRGPGDAVAKIDVPTLFLQGTVDTLFTLDEAVTNHAVLAKHQVPTAMAWFCGGHGTCLSHRGDDRFVAEASMAWLDRYVKGDTSVDVGPGFRFVDQEGTVWSAPTYPNPAVGSAGTTTARGTGDGTLTLVAAGGAGPIQPGKDGGVLTGLVVAITPAKADHAVNVTVDPPTDGMALGAPQLTLTYSGTTPAGDRPTRVFAQLVDDETGLVVGNQITPIAVTLDGTDHTATVPMEMIAHRVRPGKTLTLQLVATTVAYAGPRLGGSVTFDDITVELPVVTSGLTEGLPTR